MARASSVVRIVVLLAQACATGCGSDGGSSATPSDAESDASSSHDTGNTSSDAASEDSASEASEDASPPAVDDAGCVGDALGPQMGAAFLCGNDVCFSGSQYCLHLMGGAPPAPPEPQQDAPDAGFATCSGCKCAPLPCVCRATPACACLGPAELAWGSAGFFCSADDAGDLLLQVFLP